MALIASVWWVNPIGPCPCTGCWIHGQGGSATALGRKSSDQDSLKHPLCVSRSVFILNGSPLHARRQLFTEGAFTAAWRHKTSGRWVRYPSRCSALNTHTATKHEATAAPRGDLSVLSYLETSHLRRRGSERGSWLDCGILGGCRPAGGVVSQSGMWHFCFPRHSADTSHWRQGRGGTLNRMKVPYTVMADTNGLDQLSRIVF